MRVPEAADLQDLDACLHGAGVDTARQYSRFGGRYPRMGTGFPRRYIDITPQEILYDPTRILGAGRVYMVPTGETVLRQPRRESPGYRVVEL